MDGETETQELPMFDDGPTEDVDIEITEEDLGENLADFDDSEEEEEEEEQQEEAEEEEAEQEESEEASDEEEEEEEEVKPKRRRSSENRIAELARRAADAERRAQELEARARQEAELRQQSDIAMMTHYEQRLQREATFVKAQLEDAIAVGDTKQQVELQSQLFQLQSDLSGVETWKQQAAAQRAQQEEAAKAVPPLEPKNEQRPVSLEPRTAQWIQRNSWFQPQSPDFDPEMHEEATLFAKRVERRLRADGREEEIGSAAYFKQIDQHIREEFPDAFDDPKPVKKAAPPMRRESNVAAVNRSAPDGQGVKSKVIRLSADERRMAHNMADSGAYRKPNGQRMTHAEAEKYHATFILKQKRK